MLGKKSCLRRGFFMGNFRPSGWRSKSTRPPIQPPEQGAGNESTENPAAGQPLRLRSVALWLWLAVSCSANGESAAWITNRCKEARTKAVRRQNQAAVHDQHHERSQPAGTDWPFCRQTGCWGRSGSPAALADVRDAGHRPYAIWFHPPAIVLLTAIHTPESGSAVILTSTELDQARGAAIGSDQILTTPCNLKTIERFLMQ